MRQHGKWTLKWHSISWGNSRLPPFFIIHEAYGENTVWMRGNVPVRSLCTSAPFGVNISVFLLCAHWTWTQLSEEWPPLMVKATEFKIEALNSDFQECFFLSNHACILPRLTFVFGVYVLLHPTSGTFPITNTPWRSLNLNHFVFRAVRIST